MFNIQNNFSIVYDYIPVFWIPAVYANQWDGPSHLLSASMCQTDMLLSDKLEEESWMNIKRIGIDLAKEVFKYTEWIAQKRYSYVNNYEGRKW